MAVNETYTNQVFHKQYLFWFIEIAKLRQKGNGHATLPVYDHTTICTETMNFQIRTNDDILHAQLALRQQQIVNPQRQTFETHNDPLLVYDIGTEPLQYIKEAMHLRGVLVERQFWRDTPGLPNDRLVKVIVLAYHDNIVS